MSLALGIMFAIRKWIVSYVREQVRTNLSKCVYAPRDYKVCNILFSIFEEAILLGTAADRKRINYVDFCTKIDGASVVYPKVISNIVKLDCNCYNKAIWDGVVFGCTGSLSAYDTLDNFRVKVKGTS